MLINTTWLLEYLDPSCPEEDLLNAFAEIGLEVEAYHPLARELESITIGLIRDKAPLVGAEGMYICTAEVEEGKTLQVVCASEHPLEIGWAVPIASGGTKLPTGILIKTEKFHGILSEGMICLDSELGLLSRGSGLQVFEDESYVGRRLIDVIDVDGSIVDVKPTANRGDWLSLVGIAREVAAKLNLSLKLLSNQFRESDPPTQNFVTVRIDEPSLCYRYMCRVIRNVTIQKSPPWLSSRLRSVGSNPINNVVDVTNFVLHEYGHPLHAFDLQQVRQSQIVVRKMLASENLQLLDGTIISGRSRPLVIADAERPVALAGIMGGKDTEIENHTTDVLLEAAYFHPVQIKTSMKELGLDSTNASYRFERGVDPNETLERALDRAAALIQKVAGGTIAQTPVDVNVTRVEPREFQLSVQRVSSYLGMPVSETVIRDCLQRLGMECSSDLRVKVPTRRVDVNSDVVLIEDIARILGYEHIPLAKPVGTLTSAKRNRLDEFRLKIAGKLSNSGFLETRSLPLQSLELANLFGSNSGAMVTVMNAKEDFAVVRNSLLPSLIEAVGRNARRDAESFRFFEIDRTFYKNAAGLVETWRVAAVAGGMDLDVEWSRNKPKVDFFRMKGLAETILESAGIEFVSFRSARRPGFKSAETAEVLIDGDAVGTIGAIETELLTTRKINERIFAFEFNLEKLLKAAPGTKQFVKIPRTPSIVRDLALIIDTTIPYDEIERRIREEAGPLLENIRCIDVYNGQPIPTGKRSVSIRLRFRDPARTLETEVVSGVVAQIVDAIAREYGAQLR